MWACHTLSTRVLDDKIAGISVSSMTNLKNEVLKIVENNESILIIRGNSFKV